MPTFASMFAGIGGFDLGLTRAGWQCVWANEWNKYACQIYKKNFGEKELYEGDIRDLSTDKIPDIDLLVGGFPCQSFSIAGKRKGTNESRGTLFAQIVRVASAKRPKLLLLENVKGLLSSDDGGDFAKIIRVLGNLGYLLEWQVLNSKYFGVPQNRERVFIVGHLGEKCTRQIFPIRQVGGSDDRTYKETQSVRSRIRNASSLNCSGSGVERNLIAHTISQRYYKDGSENLLDIRPCLTPDRLQVRQQGRRFKENGEDMFTLTGQDIHGVSIGNKLRRLTPLECERLQGFPDGWTSCVSDVQRYKCLGNAVTVNVIEFLGQLLLPCLTS